MNSSPTLLKLVITEDALPQPVSSLESFFLRPHPWLFKTPPYLSAISSFFISGCFEGRCASFFLNAFTYVLAPSLPYCLTSLTLKLITFSNHIPWTCKTCFHIEQEKIHFTLVVQPSGDHTLFLHFLNHHSLTSHFHQLTISSAAILWRLFSKETSKFQIAKSMLLLALKICISLLALTLSNDPHL